MTKKSWREFRDTGLLWWINMILHTFGWAIISEVDDDGDVLNAYPARVKYRGFETEVNDEGYTKIARYLKDNSNDL